MAILRPRSTRTASVAGRFQRHEHADLAETVADGIVQVMADHAAASPTAWRRGEGSCSRRWWRWRWKSHRPPCRRRRDNAGSSARRRRSRPFRRRPARLFCTSAWNSSLRATKSVSEFTSTTTPVAPDTAMPTRPSAATRSDFFAALDRPFLRNQSMAASMSPSVSAERLLAIHHAGAGLLAKILHQGGGDSGHERHPLGLLSFWAWPRIARVRGLWKREFATVQRQGAGQTDGAPCRARRRKRRPRR